MNEKLVEEIMNEREKLGPDFINKDAVMDNLKDLMEHLDIFHVGKVRNKFLRTAALLLLSIEQTDSLEATPKTVWISPVDTNNIGRK